MNWIPWIRIAAGENKFFKVALPDFDFLFDEIKSKGCRLKEFRLFPSYLEKQLRVVVADAEIFLKDFIYCHVCELLHNA